MQWFKGEVKFNKFDIFFFLRFNTSTTGPSTCRTRSCSSWSSAHRTQFRNTLKCVTGLRFRSASDPRTMFLSSNSGEVPCSGWQREPRSFSLPTWLKSKTLMMIPVKLQSPWCHRSQGRRPWVMVTLRTTNFQVPFQDKIFVACILHT